MEWEKMKIESLVRLLRLAILLVNDVPRIIDIETSVAANISQQVRRFESQLKRQTDPRIKPSVNPPTRHSCCGRDLILSQTR